MRYRILGSRDRRFDGCFFVAVTSTGIYCRPSCPAIVPKRENVRFYPSAAAAQGAGFRAVCAVTRTRSRARRSGTAAATSRAGDGVDRGRRRRPRGRRGPRAARGLQRAPPHAAAHRGARRGAARARSRAAVAERADADPDERPATGRRRVRGGLLQRAPVQRHDPRGLRAHADGAASHRRQRGSASRAERRRDGPGS